MQRDAREWQETSRCTVYLAMTDANKIVGFLSLSMHALQVQVVEGVGDVSGNAKVSTILLGKFGVDVRFRHEGGALMNPIDLDRDARRSAAPDARHSTESGVVNGHCHSARITCAAAVARAVRMSGCPYAVNIGISVSRTRGLCRLLHLPTRPMQCRSMH